MARERQQLLGRGPLQGQASHSMSHAFLAEVGLGLPGTGVTESHTESLCPL